MSEFKNTVATIQEDVISQRIRIAELEAQIEKMKLKTIEAIKNLDNANCEWLPAHNGKAKYIYVQEVIDVIQNIWE